MDKTKGWECPICHSKKYSEIVIRFGIKCRLFPNGTSRDKTDMNMCDGCEVIFGNPKKFRAKKVIGGFRIKG